jgi:group II intron reverse transcriptase/maturase
VIDIDIKGFFDHIDHGIMMELLQKHTADKWVLLYTERWLKAGVEGEDGAVTTRERGTPQGGVISPLLSNIYLHHCFDKWMEESNPHNPFERYADDIVIHCSNQREAETLLEKVKERLKAFSLELHPDKTRIVYCKDYRRGENHDHESFTFLGYDFSPRTIKASLTAKR